MKPIKEYSVDYTQRCHLFDDDYSGQFRSDTRYFDTEEEAFAFAEKMKKPTEYWETTWLKLNISIIYVN